MSSPVDSDAVPNLILDDQHADFFQLLTKLPDVVADDPVADIHVGPVVEHIQRSADVDLQRRGDVLSFRLLLSAKGIVKILQNGHVLRLGVIQVCLVYLANAAVDDRFLNRKKTFTPADDQLTQG